MAAQKKLPDPTLPIRTQASRFAGVDEGTACTQSSFKRGKKAFLFIGMQGGRYKAMFKLSKSMPEAIRLAKQEPDDFQTGSTAWVTARFTAEQPLPKRIWGKWLKESYELSTSSTQSSAAKKKVTKTKTKAATPKRKTVKKRASKKAKKKTSRS
jgi:hypothetical protein